MTTQTKGPNVGAEDDLPKSFGILVFPCFQALDAFGPLDALNVLSRRRQLNLAVIAETLDPVSTKAVSQNMNLFNSDFGQSIVPTHTFDNAPPLDVLIVPGGGGTRNPNIIKAVDFIKKVYPSLKYLITVCTGTIPVARTGILDGRSATTNKAAFASILDGFPAVNWVKKARWVVDGNIWSSAGVSAGLDVTFAFLAHVYGEEEAKSIANWIEYEPHTDASWDPFSEIYP